MIGDEVGIEDVEEPERPVVDRDWAWNVLQFTIIQNDLIEVWYIWLRS